ncbi:MAG TPA: NAD-dependent epimerase/dehydratase family protein, partial [Anaerolineae bacterium]|nr:NAD-dependent epimerase/dehydratase family protein [Anaerolineae bacterium]
AGEGYCSAFHGSYGLGTVVLRFANVYGPRSGHKGSVVAKFLKDAAKTGQLTIYGDGEQTRDFIHVRDLCHAIICGIEGDVGGEVFQIATGIETSINELAEMMVEKMRGSAEINHIPQRPGEIIKNYSDISKAQKTLNWSPKIPLSIGLTETIMWFNSLK